LPGNGQWNWIVLQAFHLSPRQVASQKASLSNIKNILTIRCHAVKFKFVFHHSLNAELTLFLGLKEVRICCISIGSGKMLVQLSDLVYSLTRCDYFAQNHFIIPLKIY
jgi:hypothetical protein